MCLASLLKSHLTRTRKKSQTGAGERDVAQEAGKPLSRHLLLRVSGAGHVVTCDRWPLLEGLAAQKVQFPWSSALKLSHEQQKGSCSIPSPAWKDNPAPPVLCAGQERFLCPCSSCSGPVTSILKLQKLHLAPGSVRSCARTPPLTGLDKTEHEAGHEIMLKVVSLNHFYQWDMLLNFFSPFENVISCSSLESPDGIS